LPDERQLKRLRKNAEISGWEAVLFQNSNAESFSAAF